MRAYQYFHLPSGYVSRVSDNDSTSLNFVEEIRKTLQISTYFLYLINSSGEIYAINSKLDETKNQFIRGRILQEKELNSMPVSFVQSLPDTKLLRADAPLMVRTFMAPPFSFKPLTFNNELFASLFDLVIKGEGVTAYFDNFDNALLALKTIQKLLPLGFSKKISFLVADSYQKVSVSSLDNYGNHITGECNVTFVAGKIDENNKPDTKIIDFNTNYGANKSLSPLGLMIKNADFKNANSFIGLKNEFGPYINDNGVNLGAVEIVNKENDFINKEDCESFNAYITTLNTLTSDLIADSINRILPTINEVLASEDVDSNMISQIATLRNENQIFSDATYEAYSSYLTNNYLSLEGDAANDFGYMLSLNNEMYDEFFNSYVNENITTRKARRFALLHRSLYLGSNSMDFEVAKGRIRNLLESVDISNSYQVITYDERLNGEDIFYGINAEGDFDDIELDRLGVLLYSAYKKSCDKEWRKMRLKGLEVRLKKVSAIKKFRILIEIKNRMEFYNNIFYDDVDLMLVDLNNFYFDVYGETLKTEIKTALYRDRIEFYDQNQDISYLSMINCVANSICNIKDFLETYPDLSIEQINHFIALFNQMPKNDGAKEISDYLELLKNESDLNSSFVNFRLNFTQNIYNFLSESSKNKLPKTPENNDFLSIKTNFAEKVSKEASQYEGNTDLYAEIYLPTKYSNFDAENAIATAEAKSYAAKKVDFYGDKQKVYVYIEGKPNCVQRFKLKITFEADKDLDLSNVGIVASRFKPNDEEQGKTIMEIPSLKLKKKLFSKTAKATIDLTVDPIETFESIFVVSLEKPAKVTFDIIRK